MAEQIFSPLFIFSLPRSGSTLLQRLLSSHPYIVSVAEPWLLLPFIYSIKETGIYTEYWQKNMLGAIYDFFQILPNGKNDYLDAIQQVTTNLYNKALNNLNKDAIYFLDKTPRYHLIVDEILDMFPNARFIFLWRNPLAIASSIIETWGNGRWNIFKFQVDLYKGISNLTSAYSRVQGKAFSLRYEDLVSNPDSVLKELHSYLDIPYDANLPNKFNSVSLEGQKGDPLKTKYKKISDEPLEKWKETMANPFRRNWCDKYIQWIGSENLAIMGYNSDLLLSDVRQTKIKFSFLGSDIFWAIYGFFYKFLDFPILAPKIRNISRPEHICAHGQI